MTFTNNIIRNVVLALAAVLFAAVMIAAVAPKAQAAEILGGGFDYIDTFSDFGGDFGGGYDYIDTFSDFGGSDYIDTFSDFGGSDYIDTFSDYGSDFFGSSSFMPMSSSLGNISSLLGNSSGGNRQSQTQTQSQAQSQSQSSVNINTNTNTNNVTATGGTANVTVNATAQNNVTPVCPQGTTGSYPNCVWPTPNCPSGTTGTYPNCVWPTQNCPTNTYGTWPNCQQIVNQVCPVGTTGYYPNCVYPTQYDMCPNIAGTQTTLPAGYYMQNGNCYQSVAPVYPTYPTYQTPAPYVTLDSVPYTGLDLGPVGTAMYWGFLVLWSLLAAYLIVVKRVHNSIASWITGSQETETHAPVAHAHAAPKAPVAAPQYSGIDPFIASQIKRAN